MNIIAIDPSGNFKEGKGTTGICIYSKQQIKYTLSISAKDFKSMETYWEHVIKVVFDWIYIFKNNVIVVIEDYLLYANKANSQINSRLETPKLIGVLQYLLYQANIKYFLQTASEVKHRWSDDILVYKGLIKKDKRGYKTIQGITIDRHAKDAIRHAVHFATFKGGELHERPKL